jgi:hypothetical protein
MNHATHPQVVSGLVLAAVAVTGVVLGRHQLRMRRLFLEAVPPRPGHAAVRRVLGVFWLVAGSLVAVAAIAVLAAAVA